VQYVEISDNLQRLLYSSRIYILKKLMSHKTDFQEIIKDLDMVDPNLWSNMRALEDMGLVSLHKEIDSSGRKIKTIYYITEKGRSAYQDLQTRLLKLLQ
jgi:DNA-binding HxlR family transcriptional regulator